MKKYNGMRPKKRKKLDGKRCITVNRKLQADFLSELKDKLEDEHIKRYTFIVKGSKMYTAGVFWSEKNKKKYVFRSTYEFAFFYLLENDPMVLAYIVEPFEIPFFDPKYKRPGIYKPDVLVHYQNGEIKLLEIKPKRKVGSKEVQAKAAGARNFLKEHYPHVRYEFVTEEEIFKDPGDYNKLLGEIDPEKYYKRLAKREKRKERRVEPLKDKKEMDYVRSKLPPELRYAPVILV